MTAKKIYADYIKAKNVRAVSVIVGRSRKENIRRGFRNFVDDVKPSIIKSKSSLEQIPVRSSSTYNKYISVDRIKVSENHGHKVNNGSSITKIMPTGQNRSGSNIPRRNVDRDSWITTRKIKKDTNNRKTLTEPTKLKDVFGQQTIPHRTTKKLIHNEKTEEDGSRSRIRLLEPKVSVRDNMSNSIKGNLTSDSEIDKRLPSSRKRENQYDQKGGSESTKSFSTIPNTITEKHSSSTHQHKLDTKDLKTPLRSLINVQVPTTPPGYIPRKSLRMIFPVKPIDSNEFNAFSILKLKELRTDDDNEIQPLLPKFDMMQFFGLSDDYIKSLHIEKQPDKSFVKNNNDQNVFIRKQTKRDSRMAVIPQ